MTIVASCQRLPAADMRDLILLFSMSVSVYRLVSCQGSNTTSSTSVTEANTEVNTELAVTTSPNSQPSNNLTNSTTSVTDFPTRSPVELLEYVRNYLDHWLHQASTTVRPTRPSGGGGNNNRPPIVPGSHSDQRTSNYGNRQQSFQREQYLQDRYRGRYS